MLLRFGVSNYRSIKDYQEISLVAAAIKDSGTDLIACENFNLKVLPAAAIYGANAAGKSNFLAAFRFMKQLILTSHQKGEPGKPISRKFFALDKGYEAEPTQLDCDFIYNGDRYHYGYTINNERVLEEWLFYYSGEMTRKVKKTLFHRKFGEDPQFYFGPDLKGLNKTVAELTRDNSLLLSAGAANNHKQLLDIFEFFVSNFQFANSSSRPSPNDLSRHLKKQESKNKVVEFLRYADTGIVDLETKKAGEDEKQKKFREGLQALITSFVGDEFSIPDAEDEPLELVLKHRGNGEVSTNFDLQDESAGTLALLGIMGPVFEILENGRVMVLDELNTNLHPLVSRSLISLFNSATTNPNGAQLIFSTHDTNLLCGGIMRRDQIWFAEKDPFGASHIYPLTDITTRKTDNIAKGYLNGHFGAIPFLADWQL